MGDIYNLVYVIVIIFKVNMIGKTNKEHMRLMSDLRERYFNQKVQFLCRPNACFIDMPKCLRHLMSMSADNVIVTHFKV